MKPNKCKICETCYQKNKYLINDLPKKEKHYLDRFYKMYLAICALDDLSKKDIEEFKEDFKITLEKLEKVYKKKDYDKAHELMGECITKIHLKRNNYGCN